MSGTASPTPTGVLDNTDDGELHHLYCCDADIAMCGLDLSSVEETDGTGEEPCPMCWHVVDDRRPCPVPGCAP